MFGYLWSAMAFTGFIAPLIGSKLYKKNRERKFIISSLIFMIISALLVLFASNLIFAFTIFFTLLFFAHIKIPFERVYFHRFIPSKLRASIGSIESMIISIVEIFSFPLVGYIIDLIGSKHTIFLSGIIMIPAVLIYLKINDKNTNEKVSTKSKLNKYEK